MFRVAPRLIARPAAIRAFPRVVAAPARRTISTAPPSQKSRSWKSLVARLGLAGAVIYYYNTTDVFVGEARQPVQPLPETEVESENLPTIETLSEERQRRKAVQAQLDAQKQKQQEEADKAQQNPAANGAEGGLEGLEQEADQQGAFNPETGEINWDCPCLGGMADGPCGEDFKAAFSCFVFSEEEPKGMDCIDKFKDMQNCFRQYPEVYGSELDSDADDEDDLTADAVPVSDSSSPATATTSSDAQSAPSSTSSPESNTAGKAQLSGDSGSRTSLPHTDLVPNNYKPDSKSTAEAGDGESAQTSNPQLASEREGVVPKSAFDTRNANAEVTEKQ